MSSRLRAGLIVVGLALVTAWLGYFAVFEVDDAYIVYRYADHLADGKGLVFNEGERVEGVSCLLWTLFLAGFSFAGFPLTATAPLLSALAGLILVALSARLAAAMEDRATIRGWDALAAALLAAHPAFACWSVGALETVPYAVMLVLAVLAHLRERDRGGYASAVWMGLAVLTRPEAPLLAGALALDRLSWPRRRSGVAAWCAIVGGFVVVLVSFRLVYFGAWLPNTYHAKSGAPLLDRAWTGWRYTRVFLASLAPSFGSQASWAVWIGGGVLVAILLRGWVRPRARPACLLTAALCGTVILEGGDWMPLHRFWVPVLPFVAALLAGSLSDVGRRWPRTALVLAAVFVGSHAVYGVRQRDGANGLVAIAAGYRHAHHEVARFLEERAGPGDAVALMDVGIVGYESGLRVIDITGLTNRAVALSPGGFLDKRYPVEALLEQRPRFFVLVAGFPTDTRIALHPDFLRHYRPVFERNHRFNWTPPDSYVLQVFERVVEPASR
jgi:hypothetical protein